MNPIYKGTIQEFEQLVKQNKLLLYSIVYGITGNFEADDIVQETFIYAFYHYEKLKDKNKLASWLCAIAKNKAIDCLKRNSRTVSIDVLAESASNVTPETLLLKQEKKNELMREIFALSNKYRETVLLYYFAEKSIREISEILSVPEGTVKFRLSESRKKLKKELFGMIEEEKLRINKKDIFTSIKEKTEKAYKAISENNTKQASDICDAMLEEIGDLSARSESELIALENLYQAKARSIRYAEGIAAADKYYKKAVEVMEASGNPNWISDSYSYYAAELSNMGRKEESSKYYKMALEKAEKCGNISTLADCLYWNGISAYQNKEEDCGLSYFERVLSMKDELYADHENDSKNKISYALAYSASVALKRVGNKMKKLNCICTTVPIILKEDNGLKLKGQPGFGNNDKKIDDIFYQITRMEPCLSDKLHVGYIAEQNTFSYSHNAIRTKIEVISMDETVITPTGKFYNCLHTRYTNYLDENENELNKSRNGVKDIWYAPDIGVVCMVFCPIQGEKYSLKLKQYQVEAITNPKIPDKYLPLSIGNKWSYETYDFNDVPCSDSHIYENLFEVVFKRKHDNASLIAHSGWCYPKE